MNRASRKHSRILAIAPSTRGFGFAVLEGQDTLVDWGVKSVKGDKNNRSLEKVEWLIVHYQPAAVVLQDYSTKQSRRSARIKALSQKIVAAAPNRNTRVALLSHQLVRRAFFADSRGTKYALAEILVKQFPEELGFRLPPKRRPWMSEDYRMDIFDAVALGLAYFHSR